MARHTGPVCKLCRREGQKLFLKGDRCYSEKCAMNKRAYAPGQHGNSRKKLSEYGLQLREKQKAKRYYGVLETQFRNYFQAANSKQGVTGDNLLQLLELRLDNAVFRLGLGSSRKEARQLIKHNHFLVNGSKVNIPSYSLSEGDVISLKEASKKSEKFKTLVETMQDKTIPDWLDCNKETVEAKVASLPTRDDIDIPIAEHLIVELYSK